MVSMAQQVPGQNSCILIVLLLPLCFCKPEKKEIVAYFDVAKTKIITAKGITKINTTPINGVVFSLYETGDTLSVIHYLNGKENGLSRSYYAKGKMKSLRFYINGWKQSEHAGWFENGQKQFLYHFENDVFHGNQKEWLVDGQIYSELNYDKGIESGSQRVWYTNGKIKTNYIIKNNRRYGLLGTKNCVNAVDSVFTKL
jgi:antitoxin component YwqK of YwqJK toxin-antitoxin module